MSRTIGHSRPLPGAVGMLIPRYTQTLTERRRCNRAGRHNRLDVHNHAGDVRATRSCRTLRVQQCSEVVLTVCYKHKPFALFALLCRSALFVATTCCHSRSVLPPNGAARGGEPLSGAGSSTASVRIRRSPESARRSGEETRS
jgi:hypothetical protein